MSIGLFENNMERGGVQIISLFFINLLFSIYIAKSKAYKKRILNFSEHFNEFIVQMATIQMTVFSDFVIS